MKIKKRKISASSNDSNQDLTSVINPGDRVRLNFGIYSGKEGTVLDIYPNEKIADADPEAEYYSVELDGPGYKGDYIIFKGSDLEPIKESTDCVNCAVNIEGSIEKIKSSSAIRATTRIPSPFDKYYRYMTDEEFESEYEFPAHPSPVEVADRYDVKHVAYAQSKKNYIDSLADVGMEIVELVEDEGETYLAYVVNGRVYPVDIGEVENAAGMDDSEEDFTDEIDSSANIEGSIDTGINYWYFGRHGIGPGTIPQGVTVLDTVEDGWKTWMLLDKMLTTAELNEYELKEEFPPEGSVTHNGDVIEGATVEEMQAAFDEYTKKQQKLGDQLDDLQETAKKKSGFFGKGKKRGLFSSDCTKINETENSISYVVSSEDAYENEDDEILGMSLINYKDYKIMPNKSTFCWDILNSDNDLVATGFDTDGHAREFIDSQILGNSNILGEDQVDEEDEVADDNEDDEFGSAPEQEYSSAETAINGKQSLTDLNVIDVDKLKEDLTQGCIEYLTGPEGGFLHPDEPKESKWDMYATDVFEVEIHENLDNICAEVRAELDYNGMENLSVVLDKIIQKYDPEAYFDMEEPGIMTAYMFYETDYDDVDGTTEVTADRDTDNLRKWEDSRLDPPEYEIEEKDDLSTTFDFEIEIEIKGSKGEWEVISGDPLYSAEIFDEEGVGRDQMEDDFLDLLTWNLPVDSGKYSIKGKATLTYRYEDGGYSLNTPYSKIKDIEITRIGKVESSTEVEAGPMMTESELDDAILEGKPFDLESFRKYKTNVDNDSVRADQVKVGDEIEITEDASELDLGTVVKILSINDPKESWIEYTFKCEVLNNPEGMVGIKPGSEVTIHFDGDEYIGPLV